MGNFIVENATLTAKGGSIAHAPGPANPLRHDTRQSNMRSANSHLMQPRTTSTQATPLRVWKPTGANLGSNSPNQLVRIIGKSTVVVQRFA